MKNWLLLLLIPFMGSLVFIFSCNNDKIGGDDYFTLDTLAIVPSTIDDSFEVKWGVSTTDYPLFNIDI